MIATRALSIKMVAIGRSSAVEFIMALYFGAYFPNSPDWRALTWKGFRLGLAFMKVNLPLNEMTVSQKIETMEEIWADLSKPKGGYSPPDWHGSILEERRRLAESGEIGFTDWETAKKEIRDRTS